MNLLKNYFLKDEYIRENSYPATPVATETFRLCLIPRIGISACISAISDNFSDTPVTSFPTIKHTGKFHSISYIGFDFTVCSSKTSDIPCFNIFLQHPLDF